MSTEPDPHEHARPDDHLVEPLFAGIRDAHTPAPPRISLFSGRARWVLFGLGAVVGLVIALLT